MKRALILTTVLLMSTSLSFAQDTDGDGYADGVDNAPYLYNPLQRNTDGDARGDIWDPDIDGDGIGNLSDNAPYFGNVDQLDADGDGVGDVVDPDPTDDTNPGTNLYADPGGPYTIDTVGQGLLIDISGSYNEAYDFYEAYVYLHNSDMSLVAIENFNATDGYEEAAYFSWSELEAAGLTVYGTHYVEVLLYAGSYDNGNTAVGATWGTINTTTPEPASIGLLAAGIPILLHRRRRR